MAISWTHQFFGAVIIILSAASAIHAVINKRDPRAAFAWAIICFIAPGFGAISYWTFGINRIRTRARQWVKGGRWLKIENNQALTYPSRSASVPTRIENVSSLMKMTDAITRRSLLPGNQIKLLCNGEEAYPAMLDAIRSAKQYVYLSTYIFDSGEIGLEFVRALREAAERNVDVRILIDGMGELYNFSCIGKKFRGSKVHFCRFLPFSLLGKGFHINLRNHRKILIIDHHVGFTGGMNIGDRHLVNTDSRSQPTADIHFEFAGPILGDLYATFLEDWHFASGEKIKALPFRSMKAPGETFCHSLASGPNEDFEALRWVLLGAITCARRKICLMTPYFLPDRALIAALCTAVMRGIEVVIVLPGKSNLLPADWASQAFWWELLEHGVKIHTQPEPFNHAKLFLVDDFYAMVGSANIDSRSLRLNFELNLAIYDWHLPAQLARYFETIKKQSRQINLEEMQNLNFFKRLRNGIFKLFSPYW